MCCCLFRQFMRWISAKVAELVSVLPLKEGRLAFGTAFVLLEASADEADRNKLNNNK